MLDVDAPARPGAFGRVVDGFERAHEVCAADVQGFGELRRYGFGVFVETAGPEARECGAVDVDEGKFGVG